MVDLPCNVVEIWMVDAHKRPSLRVTDTVGDMITENTQFKVLTPLRHIDTVKGWGVREVLKWVAHVLDQIDSCDLNIV